MSRNPEAKRRQRAARNARDAVKEAALRAQGAKCGNCRSRSKGRVCELLTDSDGVVTVRDSDICLKWSAKAA